MPFLVGIESCREQVDVTRPGSSVVLGHDGKAWRERYRKVSSNPKGQVIVND